MKKIFKIRKINILILILCCFGFIIFYPSLSLSTNKKNLSLPMKQFRKNHPRLFLNNKLILKIKKELYGKRLDYYKSIKHWANKNLKKKFKSGDYGNQAAAYALIYLFEKELKYLSVSKKLLKKSITFYKNQIEKKKAVSWYNASRINALCSYDWLYNSLTVKERNKFGNDLLNHVGNVQPDSRKKTIIGRNLSDHTTGFYGTASLLWFAGLACYGDGTDDRKSKQYLERGFDNYLKMLKYRKKIAGDDGGLVTYSLNYSLKNYPWAEFNFFHTIKSAFDKNYADDWPYIAYLIEYILWNKLPGNRWFGSGDAYHKTNRLPGKDIYTHLAQIRHFYGKRYPNLSALGGWIQKQLKNRNYVYTFPAVPLLLTEINQTPAAKKLSEFKLPNARHFKNIGQIFMKSGWGEEDTYASFTAGGISEKHKHFDENNFLIFKKGFLALDTGSRPEPGSHLFNYYCRTIAHNCILINMPGEKMPKYWGRYAPDEPRLPTPNDGGQYKKIGAVVLAFETNRDFTYLASDAAKAYNPAKCSEALRQFVFIPPNFFVIFDRVISKKANYKKKWLLHTAQKPKISGRTFSSYQNGGSIYCRSMLPERSRISIVGGTGKQFWNGGRNWPFPKGYKISSKNELVGQWRVEISPLANKKRDVFLHFIEVGEKNNLKKISIAKLIKNGRKVGIAFKKKGLTAKVMFGLDGFPSGEIRLKKNNSYHIERNFKKSIQKQTSLMCVTRIKKY